MPKPLRTILKERCMSTKEQYFDYCIDNYIIANYQLCRKLAYRMYPHDRKQLVAYIATYNDNSEIFNKCHTFFLDLI